MRKPASHVQKTSPLPPRAPGGMVSPWMAVLALVVVTTLAYANSFYGAFVYDDIGHIVNQLSIKPLWPLTDVIRAGGPRWLLIWTLSLNYTLGGLDPGGYHALNLAIHLATGLLLWKLTRGLLRKSTVGGALAGHADALAFAIALIWLVHPLQTQGVTYIVQRCESMMALCYLAILCCLLESTQRAYRYAWLVGAVVCFWVGLGTKEVIATAPLVALAFDRIYLSSSWKEVLRQRGWVYGVMLLPLLLVTGRIKGLLVGNTGTNVGFGLDSLTWWEYAMSQPLVILHYLRLVLIPYPLCIDYEWPVATSWQEVALPGAVVLSLLLLTCWALWARPRLGFLGLSFILVLAPTSSVMPIGDLAVEHRMYLALAPVVVLLVLGGYSLLKKLASARQWTLSEQEQVYALAVVVPVVTFAVLTFCRNADYASPITLWRATVAVRPQNARANHNLCAYLVEEGLANDAIAAVEDSIARCKQRGWPTRRHLVVLGETHARLGQWKAAQSALAEATAENVAHPRKTPTETRLLAEAYLSLATSSAAAGEADLAEPYFHRSLELRPDFAFAHALYGEYLAQQGRDESAAETWQTAARLQPDWFEVQRDLAQVLSRLGKDREALAALTVAAKLRPDDDVVRQRLRTLQAGNHNSVPQE